MRFKKNEEGIALITTLLMLGLMLVLALSAIISSTTDIQVSRNVKENTRDIFIADGGLEWFKSQASYYGNYNFSIQNPYLNTLNTPSIVSGASSKLFTDGLKWIDTTDANWEDLVDPTDTACTSSSGRDNSTFPLFYTSVTVGARTACMKVYSPVWEGIYYTRSDGTDLYYPRDHVGNYRLNFDSSPVANINPAKPNFFAVRFPDATSTETVSVPQKSVMSDVRFIFGNNLYFFQENPYADPQTCNTSSDNPDGVCTAYNPNSATINAIYQPPAAGTNPAIDGEPIEGVCTNNDDTKALLIFRESGGIKYLHGIARRYDDDPESTSIEQVVADLTEDDNPYTFMLGNNGTNDVGTEIDGSNAENNCYDPSGASTACNLVDFKDTDDYSYAGFIKVVKVGVKDGSCQADIFVPYNSTGGTVDIFEPWDSGESTESQSTTGLAYPAATYSMMLVDLSTYMTSLLAQLETINTAIDADCTWDAITSTDIYTVGTSQANPAYATGPFDFSKYETQTAGDQSVTEVTGSIFTVNSTNVTHDNLEFPQ